MKSSGKSNVKRIRNLHSKGCVGGNGRYPEEADSRFSGVSSGTLQVYELEGLQAGTALVGSLIPMRS